MWWSKDPKKRCGFLAGSPNIHVTMQVGWGTSHFLVCSLVYSCKLHFPGSVVSWLQIRLSLWGEMGDWKVGRRRNCASPIPRPTSLLFQFWSNSTSVVAASPGLLLLPWSSPSQIPSVVQPVLIGQPWLLESGNSSSSCGISITRDYSGFLLVLLLEMSLSLLWLFSSFSTVAISSPYSVPSLKDLACTCLFSWLDSKWGR